MVLMRVFFTSDDAEKSFLLTEAAALRKLAHPALAAVYDVGTTSDEYPFVTFEDVEGTPLADVPLASLRMTGVITAVIVDVCSALAAVHGLRRVLRCLSPQSILVDVTTNRTRIALAHWMPSITSASPLERGRYDAPELTSSRPIDARADMYSFGVLLYETLTGKVFADIAAVEASGMLSHLVVQALTETAPLLPDAVGQWLCGLVEHERSMRFFSIREALDFLVARQVVVPDAVGTVAETPCILSPVHPVGVDAALGAIANIRIDTEEAPVLEISGEPGLGKTMILHSLQHTANARVIYVDGAQETNIGVQLQQVIVQEAQAALERRHKPEHGESDSLILFVIDDSEFLNEALRDAIKRLLFSERAARSSIRVIAAHRSQLAVFGGKAQSLTLSNLMPPHLPLFCSEMLGRCAFSPEFYKELYSLTKGHPLFLEETLRFLIRNNVLVRMNRVWATDIERFDDIQPSLPLSLTTLIVTNIRAMSEEMQQMLILLVVLETPSVHGIALHLIAEILDISTQAVMRLLLPLMYDGYVRLNHSHATLSHDLYKEALNTGIGEEALTQMREMVHRYWAAISEQTANGKEHLPALSQQISALGSSETPQNGMTTAPTTPETRSEVVPGPVVMPAIKESAQQPQPIPVVEIPATAVPSVRFDNDRKSQTPLQTGILSGTSGAVQRLRRQIELAAQYEVPVLLEGGFGSAKEEIASIIHGMSNRAAQPFHAVVCSDFSEAELDQYLFGSNSQQNSQQNPQKSVIAQTQGGILFIDDIAAAAMPLQAKLARLTQIAQMRLRGQNQPTMPSTLHNTLHNTNARLIIGCGRDGDTSAEQALQAGTFHPELFFAVSSLRVTIPSLNERREDIPVLVGYYREMVAAEFGRSDTLGELPSTMLQSLMQQQWTGNVMELESLVRRLVLTQDLVPEVTNDERQPILAPPISSNLPSRLFANEDDPILSIDDAQKEHILRALEMTSGNKTKAAEMLRIKRTTLIARMKKFGMMP